MAAAHGMKRKPLMGRRFATLDVFTDRRFAGNPLAVVLEPGGLDTVAMQTIAREFNHPETVFVFPPSQPAHRAKLRIFTPKHELPFAGHPTVGTAVLLGQLDGGGAARAMVLEEAIGDVQCRVEPIDDNRGRARFMLPKLPNETGAAPDDTTVAGAVGLAPGEIGFGGFRPSCWSAGNAFTFVPVAGLAAIGRCRPDAARHSEAFGDSGVYIFTGETVEAGHAFHARMFAPRLGITEDPATGSAAAAFAGMLSAHGGLADGEHSLTIEQGYEMGRPSLIGLTLTLKAGKLVSAAVAGDAVVATRGTIEA
jgi:trans-2,3-dihydro-3-hydroxyanthranilate isomerase